MYCFSTKTVNLKSVKNEKKIYYHLNYSLNLEQERTSRLLIERYQNHQNTVLKAVTGAGKTEMVYGVIEYALNLGHHVCLTMPRKELVIELAKRIQKQFLIFSHSCLWRTYRVFRRTIYYLYNTSAVSVSTNV